MSKITLEDSQLVMIMKLSEKDGEPNPGATQAIMDLIAVNKIADPDSAWGPVSAMLSLSSYEIYGTDIYVLWSDICHKDTVAMIAVLRACQLGMFSSDILKDACSRQDYSGQAMVDVADFYKQVCERLPRFDEANRVQVKDCTKVE